MSETKQALVIRIIKGFAFFWWDFLVGDTPELFVGTVLVLGIAAMTSLLVHLRVLTVIVLPVSVLLMLLVSVLRVVRAKRSS